MSRSRNTAIIEKLFSLYYRGNPGLELPEDMELREFAVKPFRIDTYIRHLAFSSPAQLLEFVRREVPEHLYYSSARYEYPEAPNMDDKKWLGSDLIFDIDADHLPGCRPVEIETGRGKASIVPFECIRESARHALRLLRMLERDFGAERVSVYFSGHRGFHLHVPCDERCGYMDSAARREIVDYLKANGIDVEFVLGYKLLPARRRRSRPRLLPPSPRDPGWRGWIGSYLEERGSDSGGNLIDSAWKAIGELRIEVDEKVTIDTSRLVRIPGSLHGKTGLMVSRVDPSVLEEFSAPIYSFSPFRGMLVVKPLLSLDVEVFGERLRLAGDKAVKLEAPLGLFLASKGLAVIVDAEEVKLR